MCEDVPFQGRARGLCGVETVCAAPYVGDSFECAWGGGEVVCQEGGGVLAAVLMDGDGRVGERGYEAGGGADAVARGGL